MSDFDENTENVPLDNLVSPDERKSKPKSIDEIRDRLKKRVPRAETLAVTSAAAPRQRSNKETSSIQSPRGSLAEPNDSGKQTSPPSKSGGGTTRRKSRSKEATKNFGTEDKDLIKDKYCDLASLCEEILTYCHLLDNSRNHTVTESLSLRETVRELERLLDSARQREVNHLNSVDQHREALATFEKRYYNLKGRAKTHIKECQDDRDKLRRELDTISSKMKTAESELYAAQSLVHSQQIDLDRLREQTRNMLSEKELTTMSLKLRRLEDENGRLATEKQQLIAQLDELQGGKRDDRGGGLPGKPDALGRSKRETELEQTVERLQADLRLKNDRLAEANAEAKDLRECCDALLERVDAMDARGSRG